MIYRSPDGFKAFDVVANIINDLASGKIQFETAFLEAAKSSVSYAILSSEVFLVSTARVRLLGNRVGGGVGIVP